MRTTAVLGSVPIRGAYGTGLVFTVVVAGVWGRLTTSLDLQRLDLVGKIILIRILTKVELSTVASELL